MASKTGAKVDPLGLVSELIDTGTVDTVYRDVYLRRARTLLAGVFSSEEYRRIEAEKTELATMPVVLGRALEKGDWPRVKELSSRGEALRRSVGASQRQVEVARGVYAVTDVKLDPFSPGLLPFTGISGKALPGVRSRAVEHLASLERADAPWKDFYSERGVALRALTVTASESPAATGAVSIDPREAAQRALQAGDMKGLAKLADTLMAAARSVTTPSAASEATARPAAAESERTLGDLLTTYSDDTLREARRLGLAARRLESRTEIAPLRRYAWSPVFSSDAGRASVKQVELPAGTPEGFRERLEMLMIHPLVNSGGARHLPRLVAEDVLVETFPEPKEGETGPVSELLTTLGLQARRAVPRIAIEQALLTHGADVLEQRLGLDPRVFRLVCIPPDVHLRIGETEGWGSQPLWTHFDGYIVMADGRLRALAGGEARFGGLFNLIGISRDYDSDRVISRFAVVRRERMVAW
jgi:hypothetical protein